MLHNILSSKANIAIVSVTLNEISLTIIAMYMVKVKFIVDYDIYF